MHIRSYVCTGPVQAIRGDTSYAIILENGDFSMVPRAIFEAVFVLEPEPSKKAPRRRKNLRSGSSVKNGTKRAATSCGRPPSYDLADIVAGIGEPMTARSIAAKTGVTVATIYHYLHRAEAAGLLRKTQIESDVACGKYKARMMVALWGPAEPASPAVELAVA